MPDARWKRRRRLHLGNREEWKCFYCDAELDFETLTIDHIIPRSKGGSNRADNMVASCRKCNNKKGSRDPIAFLRQKMDLPQWNNTPFTLLVELMEKNDE